MIPPIWDGSPPNSGMIVPNTLTPDNTGTQWNTYFYEQMDVK